VALVGENGAGKSTVVRCVSRAVSVDSGHIAIDGVEVGRTPRDAIDAGLSVVWQDLALCENLDVTANLFLGRELGLRGALRGAEMRSRSTTVFKNLRVEMPELDRPVERLSGGQRQLVAIARATLDQPRVLILDEPTAALGIAESRTVLDIIRRLREQGVCIVLVSHQPDEVFDIADRIVVLRHGKVVADVHRAEAHPDDVVAMITGAGVDSTAGQQLRRLHSLAEQLAEADQSSVLPMTVSSLSGALSTDRMAILMGDPSPESTTLRLSAVLNLPDPVAELLQQVDPAAASFVAEAARERALLVIPRLRDRVGDPLAQAAIEAGMVGAWAAPIVGQDGPLAVIAGFSDTATILQPDQVQLLELFSRMAGVAVERGRLVETLGDRNQALEGLRGLLETLAGPDLPRGGMSTALDALCAGVGSDEAILLLAGEAGDWSQRAASSSCVVSESDALTVAAALDSPMSADPSVMVTDFAWSGGRGGLICRWSDEAPAAARQVLDGAANSFRLALERELAQEAEQEAEAVKRSRTLERQLTRRIGHELRTPLTAIQGYASTMLQPDVAWDDGEKQRFLAVIEREAGRMGRLVAQMFDESALESGLLRLNANFYDLSAVLRAAASVAAPQHYVVLDVPERCEVWGDSDRLEQVFVNLIGNAIQHNPEHTRVAVHLARPNEQDTHVRVVVSDDGRGLPPDALDYLSGVIQDRDRNLGLGLRLIRGLVQAHGGHILAEAANGSIVQVVLPIEAPLLESEPKL
jgi:signal transduction histidine kinase/ABC-type multidrug transport system ATPase subunit